MRDHIILCICIVAICALQLYLISFDIFLTILLFCTPYYGKNYQNHQLNNKQRSSPNIQTLQIKKIFLQKKDKNGIIQEKRKKIKKGTTIFPYIK